MRTIPCWVLAGLLVACGTESAPPAPTNPSEQPAVVSRAALPATSDATTGVANNARGELQPQDAQVAAAESPSPAGEAHTTALRILREATAAGPAAQAKAPNAIRSLGIAALPALTDALHSANVTERRIAALTLLQWSDDLHRDGNSPAVVAALAAARDDADPSVRAAAEHAYRRATGDTSALDQSRAADEAAQRQNR